MLTRRRDQLDFKRNPNPSPVAADQIIGGTIFCDTAEGRRAWVTRLNKKHPLRFNYFIYYHDVQSRYALSFGHADWASLDHPYINY